MATVGSSAIISILDAKVADRNLLKHPFYQAWTAGTLSIERLRDYSVHYYPHVAAFPRYVSGVHSRCDDMVTRRALLENLIEEERGAGNHPELWLRFAEALGVARETVTSSAPAPASSALVSTFLKLTQDSPAIAGLSALYVYESQIPAVSESKIDGLKRFYGVADPRGLEFFTVHQSADIDHARIGAELISRHCVSAADEDIAVAAADVALKALWSMLDSV